MIGMKLGSYTAWTGQKRIVAFATIAGSRHSFDSPIDDPDSETSIAAFIAEARAAFARLERSYTDNRSIAP